LANWHKLKNCQKLPNPYNMAKKFFARARVVKGARWYIDFSRFDPETGTESRSRKDFDLNDIENLEIREAVANRLAQYIEIFAPAGSKPEKPSGPTLRDAVTRAVAAKQLLPREVSRRRYVTISKPFLEWAKKQRIDCAPVDDFTRKHARQYWQHLQSEKQLKGKSLNGYLGAFRAIWNEVAADLDQDGFKNPWTSIKTVRVEEKQRRPFTDEERRTVATAAMDGDYWLFRAIVLQFFCYIRPVELTRLKFKDFDFSKGTVTIRETENKSYKKVVKTLPTSVITYFLDGTFDKYPANFFVFGLGSGIMEPSTVAIDEQRLYKRHAKLLARLDAAGKLPGGIKGLSFYSWKDTGISLHAARTGAIPTKDQAGHASLDMTSVYYQAPEVLHEYKFLENTLFL
jgi:integrase